MQLRQIVFILAACLYMIGCDQQETLEMPAPKQLLSGAWRSLQLKDFTAAAEQFQEVVKSTNPECDEYLEGLYGWAMSLWLASPVQPSPQAAALLDRIVALREDHELAAWSLLAQARMKSAFLSGDQDWNTVRAAYQKVLDRYPNSAPASEAFLYQQATWLSTLKKEDAQAVLDACDRKLATESDPAQAFYLHQMRAMACQTLGDPVRQLVSELKCLENPESKPDMRIHLTQAKAQPSAYWHAAVIAQYSVGDFATARRIYQRLIEEWPEEQRVLRAQAALAEMDQIEKELRGTGKSELLQQ